MNTIYSSHITILANKLIANNYAYVSFNDVSNKYILHIKNNENYNELSDDDKYNVLLYLQHYYTTKC
jgi:hypothetical protein